MKEVEGLRCQVENDVAAEEPPLAGIDRKRPEPDDGGLRRILPILSRFLHDFPSGSGRPCTRCRATRRCGDSTDISAGTGYRPDPAVASSPAMGEACNQEAQPCIC